MRMISTIGKLMSAMRPSRTMRGGRWYSWASSGPVARLRWCTARRMGTVTARPRGRLPHYCLGRRASYSLRSLATAASLIGTAVIVRVGDGEYINVSVVVPITDSDRVDVPVLVPVSDGVAAWDSAQKQPRYLCPTPGECAYLRFAGACARYRATLVVSASR
jgi:hypothetical protein